MYACFCLADYVFRNQRNPLQWATLNGKFGSFAVGRDTLKIVLERQRDAAFDPLVQDFHTIFDRYHDRVCACLCLWRGVCLCESVSVCVCVSVWVCFVGL